MGDQQEVPPLRAGTHLSPDEGACLMELVSVAAGERWHDAPRCTQPLLAHLARRVNDGTSDRRRSDLTTFIPALTLANTPGATAVAAVAAACTQVALDRRPSPLLHALHAAAVNRSQPTDDRRHWLYVHSTAYRSVDLAAFAMQGLPEVQSDEAFKRMLGNAIDVVLARRAAAERTRPLEQPGDHRAGRATQAVSMSRSEGSPQPS